jgi:2,4-dienoyl-CoA reductase-like NADH-dependent reductase (Old Yellow Enzyme family)
MQTEAGPLGRAMTTEEIQATVDAFVASASRGVEAGFDGVHIHTAHGYLLSQFLSPYFNRRTDEYGGSVENRARMLMQVVEGVQSAVGDDYPVTVKINSEDLLDGGLLVSEMLEVCGMLQRAGVDAIEMSGGTVLGLAINDLEITFCPSKKRAVYWREAAEQYKAQIEVPLILVGGIRSLETAESLVRDGIADYVSLSRPLVRQPDLVRQWQAGETGVADCISCNGCGFAGFEGKGVRCVQLDQ